MRLCSLENYLCEPLFMAMIYHCYYWFV